jgi:hypothetical protein
MKSMNEYIFEKTGLTLKTQEFVQSLSNLFSFDKCSLTESGIQFFDVDVKADFLNEGDVVIEKGKKLASLEIRKNGWVNVCEDENNSYLLMNHDLKESFALPIVGGYEQFPSVNAIQMGAMTDIQKVIATVKKLSLEDANYLKSIMGPSLEEKILRTIVDAVLFDTPPANGLQNGV